MMKKIAIGLLVLLMVTGTSFYLVGGRLGVLLLYVKYVLRKEAAPAHDISWQAGPANANALDRKKKPNVILIVADDLGFNDITLNGGGIADGTVPTPNINRIAQEGVNFQTSYSGNATCAPSRAAIMTGRYPTRFGFEFTPVPKQFMQAIGNHSVPGNLRAPIYHAEREADLIPYEDQGLPQSEISIAKLLKGAGYHTMHIGKWHLGDAPQFRSNAHGFDEALSFLHGGSMYLAEDSANVVNAKQDYDVIDRFLWAAHPFGIRFNNSEVFKPKNYATDYLTDEALKAIAANKNQPFFLYLAYNAPHTPLQATREDYDALPQIKDHTLRVYAAMIRSLDRNIGRVLQSLKEQGLDDDTLVIFTSDNGGANYIGIEGINNPYRGWKATFFEGGIRVPLFMRWPARLPQGEKLSDPVSHFDIFNTTAAAAGVAPPSDRPMDGVNLLPFIDKKASGRPHETLFWRTDSYRVIREHDWKLQVTQNPRKDWLYDLVNDPYEKRNLASSDPDRVKSLTNKIVEFNKTQVKPMWPSLGEGPIAIDKTLKQPQSADDEFIYYSN
jgi:arylsulfatase A-like enzyme